MAAPSKQKLVEEYINAREAFEALEAKVKKALGTLPVGTYPIAGVNVQVKAGANRFQKDQFETKYASDKHPEYYTPAPDLAKIKPKFAAIELDQFYKRDNPSIVIPRRKEK